MSKQFELGNTSIPSQFSVNLKNNYGLIWLEARTADFYRVVLGTFADCCRLYQSKANSRIGLSLKDDKGNFIFGTILSFQKPEEESEDDSGNWYLEFTMDEADMIDLDIDIDNHSREFIQTAILKCNSVMNGRFKNTEVLYHMFIEAINTLTTFLDVNATEGEEVEVVLRAVFTATVAYDEEGKKIFSIIPGEYIKQIIKNDAAL